MLPPRNTLTNTRAEVLLQRDFFTKYVQSVFLDGEDKSVPGASAVFTEQGMQLLRSRLNEKALSTLLTLTERLSNRVLAICIAKGNKADFIAVSSRFRADPDVLTHTLIEEYVHAHQIVSGVDVASQQREFGYHERPYEQEAKQIATEILGYDPAAYETFMRRDEPEGSLYDRPNQ